MNENNSFDQIPQQYSPDQPPQQRPLHVPSLVLGILSIPGAFVAIIGFILSIVGFILAIVSRKKSRSTVGMVLCIIGFLASVVSMVYGIYVVTQVMGAM